MGYYVYILYSPSLKSFYKGQTNDVNQRLSRHNAGHEIYTERGLPWILVWSKIFDTRSEAVILERKLKNINSTKLKIFLYKYKEHLQMPIENLDEFFFRGS